MSSRKNRRTKNKKATTGDPRSATASTSQNQGSPRRHDNAESVAEGTPIQAKASTHSIRHKKGAFFSMISKEMNGYTRQLPASQFLAEFVPHKDKDLKRNRIAAIGEKLGAAIGLAKKESDMYKPICEALTSAIPKHSVSELVGKDTADRTEDFFADHKPDITIYDKNFGDCPWQVDPPKKWEKDEKWYKAKAGFAWAICLMELKYKENYDPFEEEANHPGVLSTKEPSVDTRTQIIRYVVELFLRQHREFVFLVVIFGHKARLTRWDHAGVVITEPFDYVEHPSYLLNFIRRLAHSSRAEQGFDTSVRLADEEQIEALEGYRNSENLNDYERRLVEEMMEDQKLYPINQLECKVLPDRPEDMWGKPLEGETLTLLIGKYRVRSYSPTGRATKGYFAYVMGHRRLVFLKISWRPVGVPTEVDRYAELYAHNVPNIAKLLCGADTCHDLGVVRDKKGQPVPLRTRNQEWLDNPSLQQRVQIRLIFETLGVPLSDYDRSLAMVKAVFDALKAHQCAWDKAGILHRDISIGNIMIDITSPVVFVPRGFLTDWDLSKSRDQTDKRTQHARSGTWAFISGPLLKYPTKPPHVSDDMESVVHVVNFCALRFHHTTFTDPATWNPAPGSADFNRRLSTWTDQFFFAENRSGRYSYGGDYKFQIYSIAKPPFSLVNPDSAAKPLESSVAPDSVAKPPRESSVTPDSVAHVIQYSRAFDKLLRRIHQLCYDHYASLDTNALQKKYNGEQQPSFIPLPNPGPALLKQEGEMREKAKREIAMAIGRPVAKNDGVFLTQDSPQHTPHVPLPEDPFATHDALMQAFAAALEDFDGWERDKTTDQFLNLPGLGFVHDKPNSFSFTSSKHGRSDSDENTLNKKAKTSTSIGALESIPEGAEREH